MIASRYLQFGDLTATRHEHQARAKLSLSAFLGLNDWLLARADKDGFVPHRHGLRLVAADASTVRFGLRASHVKRAALADQFLFEHLDRLSQDDLLLLDRGYPCRWLVAALNDRAIKFCMRVDNTSSLACVTHAYDTALAGSPLMRKLLARVRPAEMSAANANNETLINEAKNRLHARMDALDVDAVDYQQQSRQLKAVFDVVETEIPLRATLPVLLSFLREKRIDSGMNDSAMRHGMQL